MKTLFFTAVCASIILGASSVAFAADNAQTAVAPSAKMMPRPENGLQEKALGAWPSHWGKAEGIAATTALNDLENKGYSTFSNFHRKGNDFEATVSQGGQAMNVLVDPALGSVTVES